MTKLKTLAAGIGLIGALGASSANAAALLDTLFAGNQLLSDNSAEVLVNFGAANTTVDVGDRLTGILELQTTEQSGVTRNLGGSSGNSEFSGIFDITVLAKIAPVLPGGTYTFIFGPSASFQSTYGAGAMVALFEDTTPDFQRETGGAVTTVSDAVTLASNGTLVATLGFNSASNFWVASSITDDISVIGSTPAPGNGGSFNSGLNFLTVAAGFQFDPVACRNAINGTIVQVGTCGSGSLLGTGGVNTPFDSFDDVNFVVNRVAEPATLALIGLGLLGFGVARRRYS